jgi:two-component system nitrogen regulation response regulator GlnG
VGELPLDLQPKLLRVLENGEYQRVGETQRRTTGARVIAATNRDLAQEVRAGRFRADLYHRLSVLRVRMPPVRQTGSDRLLLLEHFLREFSRQMNVAPCRLDASAVSTWQAYDFPGNVRELRNIVVRLLSRHAGRNIGRAELENELESESLTAPLSAPSAELLEDQTLTRGDALGTLQALGSISLDEELARLEQGFIAAALRLSRGNMSQAARMLGLNRSTLYNRMEMLARQGKPITSQTVDED